MKMTKTKTLSLRGSAKQSPLATIAHILAVSLVLFLGASQALAATGSEEKPPGIPSLPPIAPTFTTTTTANDTTATTAPVAGTATAAASTASTTSSGPKEIVAIVGLALVAVFSLKKYNQSKKYSL